MPTLVVIDMQPAFEAACDPNTVIAVANEIILAKQRLDPIVLVEYTGAGEVHEGYNLLLKNYRHKAKIRKNRDDGSYQLVNLLRRKKFPEYRLRVCGVNTDCCVWATVEGLLDRLPYTEIEVVKNACNNYENSFDWRQYIRHPNLKLI